MMYFWCLLALGAFTIGWALFYSLTREPIEIEWPRDSHLIFSDNN